MLFNKDNKIKGLVNTSNSIISVFTDTVNKLTTVNSVIDTEIDTKKEAIKTLEDDVITLDHLKKSNDHIISKVKQILE